MATFKEFSASDIRTSRSFLNQIVDFIEEDLSGSTTRQAHLCFVTGGVGPGVTSSLHQTVYDQDYTLQSANALFDVSFGISSGSITGSQIGVDDNGKGLYASGTLMMREKANVYSQFAQLLLGNSNHYFQVPFSTTQPPTSHSTINNALFFCFKRLFARDKIKRETFAMRIYQSASYANGEVTDPFGSPSLGPRDNIDSTTGSNLNITSEKGPAIFTDLGSSTTKAVSVAGDVGNIVDSSNTSQYGGLIFYDHGIAVLDVERIISASQHVSGVISGMTDTALSGAAVGQQVIGGATPGAGNSHAKFVPDFTVSGSIDNIIDHFMSCRFQSGSNTAITFQNITNINSTLFFCRASPDEFNYSSNPTYVNSATGQLNVISDEETEKSFTFITGIGLYDSRNNLLAVAKMSRPIEKNDEKDVTFRVRLDF